MRTRPASLYALMRAWRGLALSWTTVLPPGSTRWKGCWGLAMTCRTASYRKPPVSAGPTCQSLLVLSGKRTFTRTDLMAATRARSAATRSSSSLSEGRRLLRDESCRRAWWSWAWARVGVKSASSGGARAAAGTLPVGARKTLTGR
ncbi:hypothetical protein TOPH_09229 [Tolypocladium ophioglossoides CBS 100239]|uniref:Secreted protein n=1 Tax=Tolypocladium ophioglossoides (strain CBS 100239) TaxID=1163406 RepID=A0A0L0MWI7_TOLOC|nr:hypothetical protein TOPH_09229 [Tolypocladium ophioglossoides CBS 100239]